MLSLLILGIVAFAAIPQQDDDDKDKKNAPKVQPKAQPKALTVEDESIPDSLVHSRWKIQKTAPVLTADLDSSALDLRMPENVKQQVEYNDSLNLYVIGSKMGVSYLNAPIVMTPEEYMRWSERKARQQFFRVKDAENAKSQGKDKFDFSDMHFDLGPAEKIFGPGGVRVKTQGTAELKIGATLKDIDNPSLPIRNRKTTSFDFDEKRLSSYRKMMSAIIKHYSKMSGEILVYAYMYSNCTATQSAFYYCFKETYTRLGGTASIVSLQAFGQAYAKYAFNRSSENYQIFRGNMDVSSLKDSTNSLNLHTGI